MLWSINSRSHKLSVQRLKQYSFHPLAGDGEAGPSFISIDRAVVVSTMAEQDYIRDMVHLPQSLETRFLSGLSIELELGVG